MKHTAASVVIALTAPAVSACGWADDGDMANALAHSRWMLTTISGMEVVEPPTAGQFQISLVPEILKLEVSFGPVLQDNTLGDRPVTLTFLDPARVEDGQIRVGGNRFNIPYPDVGALPCGQAGLSAIVLATDEDRHQDTWAMLSVDSDQRLVGLLKVAVPYATNGEGAAMYTIEATPLP